MKTIIEIVAVIALVCVPTWDGQGEDGTNQGD
jgi:hypothetical protein